MEKQKQFLQKVYERHSNKYDYSLVKYIGARIKIKIICPSHGIFEQEPSAHLRGQGCPKCAGVKKNTKENFIKKSNDAHNNKYDYSLVNYKNNKTKVKIICPEHGEFEVRPDNHSNKKSGCPKCANNILYTTKEFIKKSKIVHGNKYNYSKVEYITAHIKVKIICKKHGIFEQEPSSHLNGNGCNKCSYDKLSIMFKGRKGYREVERTNDEFIKIAKNVHNNKYNYSLVDYKNSYSKIKIICPIHGVFEQIANSHLMGKGCKKCYIEKMRYDTNTFIDLSIKKHGNKYNYSLVNYKHSQKKVKIICPEHGKFSQKADSHLRGTGCPMCNDSKGENKISNILKESNINYIRQKTFDDCKNKRVLPFDFYLPEKNICIEFDGLQHFKPIEYFGGEKTFEKIKKTDKIKTEYCKNNGIELIRIKYNQNIKKILEVINS